jgi:hypothetical protein
LNYITLKDWLPSSIYVFISASNNLFTFPFFLQLIEEDMDLQMQKFDELNERGHEIVDVEADEMVVNKINAQLEEFQERWENLVHQMEHQSKEVGWWILQAFKAAFYLIKKYGACSKATGTYTYNCT